MGNKHLQSNFLNLQKEFQPLRSQVAGLLFVQEKLGAFGRDKTSQVSASPFYEGFDAFSPLLPPVSLYIPLN